MLFARNSLNKAPPGHDPLVLHVASVTAIKEKGAALARATMLEHLDHCYQID